MRKIFLFILMAICVSALADPIKVDIPDKNLRNNLEKKLGKNPGDPIMDNELSEMFGVLSLSDSNISDLTGLEYCTGLTNLNLNGNQISGISALSRLYNVEVLDLSGNQISDLSAFGKLAINEEFEDSKLTSLDLSNNQISGSAGEISYFDHLTDIDLSGNQITSVGLVKLKNLTSLNLSDNLLGSGESSTFHALSYLSRLTTLSDLDLSNNQIDNIDQLTTLTNLTKLKLEDNQLPPSAGAIIQNLEKIVAIVTHDSVPEPKVVNILDDSLRTVLQSALVEKYDNDFIKAQREKYPESDTAMTAWRWSGDLLTSADLDRLTDLDASNLNITTLTGLEYCTSLTRLYLNGNQISDVSMLSNLIKLTFLNLNGNQINDISVLSGLTNLEILWLNNSQISDISSLPNLTNLKSLLLSDNQISDISVLSNLTNLTQLYLNGNQINDISVLSGLTNLETLWLNNNQISEISSLSNLTNLTKLYLSDNQISDISSLSNLANLTTLNLHYNQISDISPLSNLTNLIRLWLWDNSLNAGAVSILQNLENSGTAVMYDKVAIINIADDGLRTVLQSALGKNDDDSITDAELDGLTNLVASSANISSLSGLEYCTNLTNLTLDDNQISNTSALSNLTNLAELKLSNNQISDISTLSNLTNLTKLWLGNNQIVNISALFNLTKLRSLKLEDNQLTASAGPIIQSLEKAGATVTHDSVPEPKVVNIPDDSLRSVLQSALGKNADDPITNAELDGLTDVLDASNANISSLIGLEYCTSLTFLTLDTNQISDISPLSNLTNLKSLLLSTNQISDISLLSNLTNLTTLFLWGNQISDISSLSNLTNLTKLYLNDNQINDISSLSNLINLTNLELGKNQISDISVLSGLINLTELGLDENQIIDINSLSNVTSLKSLSLLQNPLGVSASTIIQTLKENSIKVIENLTPTPTELIGDVNGDGTVNIFDLVIAAGSFGKTGAGIMGDVNEDGRVNIFDLVIVSGNFGQSLAVAVAPSIISEIELTTEQKHHMTSAIDRLESNSSRSTEEEMVLGVLKAILPERLPTQAQLLANYPNPFNPETWIPFELDQDSQVSITIYDIQGQPIRRLELGMVIAGRHISTDQAAYWNGRTETGESVGSGTYFYQLQAGGYMETKKMVILK